MKLYLIYFRINEMALRAPLIFIWESPHPLIQLYACLLYWAGQKSIGSGLLAFEPF